MFCSKCGNPMNEEDKFCTKCGFTQVPQGAAQAAPPPPQPQYAPPPPQPQYAPPPPGYGAPQGYGAPPQGYPYSPQQQYVPRKGTTLWQHIRQGDGENLVKTFHCNRLKSLLLWNMDADGFLSVTNKRLIYWSEDRKPGERTAVQGEMPLKDAAGVSFYKGKMFSWLHFVLMYAFNILVSMLAMVILGLLATASVDAFKVVALIMGFGCLCGAVVHYVMLKKLTSAVLPLLVYLSFIGFLMASGARLTGMENLLFSPLAVANIIGAEGDAIAWAIFAALTSLLYLIVIIIYALRPTFSLSIQSRAGGKGIKVAGLRLFNMGGLFSKTISTEPAEESEAMANKLGSMVSELQESGDAAIDKLSK